MPLLWLPELLNTDGVWEKVITCLYKVFVRDFVTEKCNYSGKVVVWDKRKLDGLYDEGFWHLISKDDWTTKDRLFDPPRARRLSWCKPSIENCAQEDEGIKVWGNKEKGRTKVYIWLEDLNYVIILQDRKKYYFLITAYYVEGDRTRKQLRLKYNNRLP